MPPKKGKKMALTDFIADESLGSWADEMDSLPTAPTARTDEERRGDRRDFSSSNRDQPSRDYPPREELPLPTKPPFIAFVGNLAFDIFEDSISEFFAPNVLKDIKIIKDRDEKPKGFGYVEFETLDGLKAGLALSGGQLMNRTVRISVADAPKERSGGFDDDRFAGPWRREGPLPSLGPAPNARGVSGDRYASVGSGFSPRSSAGEIAPPSLADTTSDWRSSRAPRGPPTPERSVPQSRRTSVPPSEVSSHPAIAESAWERGSKFKPSAPVADAPPPQERRSLFGGTRGDGVSPSGSPDADNDWRSAPRRTVSQGGSTLASPNASTPPTPNIGGRRKLELLPRGTAGPGGDSPLSSPKSSSTPTSKASPFGAAKPIDVAAREKQVEERIEQDRANLAATVASAKEKDSSAAASASSFRSRGPPPPGPDLPVASATGSTPPPAAADASPPLKREFSGGAAPVRPKFSFAAAAAANKAVGDAAPSDVKGNGDTAGAAEAPKTEKPEETATAQETENTKRASDEPFTEVDKLIKQVAETSV